MFIRKFVYNIWLRIKILITNLFGKFDLEDYPVGHEVSCKSDIVQLSKHLYSNFEYKYNLGKMFKLIKFPGQCYCDLTTSKLAGTAYDYHAALLHLVAKNNIPTCILSFLSKEPYRGYSTLLVMLDKKYYLIDYYNVFVGETVQEVVDKFASSKWIHTLTYKLIIFDYDRGRWKVIK